MDTKDEVERTEDVLVLDPNITFSSMHLKPELLKGFNDEGFIKCVFPSAPPHLSTAQGFEPIQSLFKTC